MIAAHSIVKIFEGADNGIRALAGVSFTIQPGEFVAIMGPSGSGKSTLLHIMSFLDRPTSGSYLFFGKKMEDLSDHELAAVRNRDMGFVFQAFNLLGRASVYENIELPLLYDVSLVQAERPARIYNAVQSVGLEEKLFVEASKLSGGQKQRAAIARALVANPRVIFADEPTGNLDSQSGMQVIEILKRLNREGRTIILVTHDPAIGRNARRLIRIRDGMIENDEIL